MLITLKEYATKQGLSYGTVRNAVTKGLFVPDKKENGQWLVDENKDWYTRRNVYLKEANSYSRIYRIWQAMKQRCLNKKHTAYYRYGGRGIKICKEWRDSAAAFIEWAYANGYDDSLTLDRKDNDKDYCPDNCQWITRSENSKKAPQMYYYKDTKSRFARLYNEMKRHGIDPSKYNVEYPFK